MLMKCALEAILARKLVVVCTSSKQWSTDERVVGHPLECRHTANRLLHKLASGPLGMRTCVRLIGACCANVDIVQQSLMPFIIRSMYQAMLLIGSLSQLTDAPNTVPSARLSYGVAVR